MGRKRSGMGRLVFLYLVRGMALNADDCATRGGWLGELFLNLVRYEAQAVGAAAAACGVHEPCSPTVSTVRDLQSSSK